MKLRDLRPCDWCGKQLAGCMPDGRLSIQFYVIRLSPVLLNLSAIGRFMQQHQGMTQFFGGHAGLADVFVPEPPDVATVVGDAKEHGGSWDEAFLCFECFIAPVSPADLGERVRERRANTAAASAESAKGKASRKRPVQAGAVEEASS